MYPHCDYSCITPDVQIKQPEFISDTHYLKDTCFNEFVNQYQLSAHNACASQLL